MNLLRLFNSIGCLFESDVSRAQRQIKKLKAQIEQLSQKLRCVQTMTDAVEIELSGPGPFQLPLLTVFKSLITELEDRVVTEFESNEGKRIYLTMPCLAAAQLVNGDIAVPLYGVTLDSSTLVDLKSASSFQLPLLSHYEGHFHFGNRTRVSVFSTQESRRIFVPLSIKTYERLFWELQTSLAFSQQPNSSTEMDLGLAFATSELHREEAD